MYRILSRSNTPSYRSYFNNIDDLGICLTIFKRLEDSFIVSKALERLKSFKTGIFFYVPQLVQELRHDKIHDMILSTLKDFDKNEIVCHQLIWNLKSQFVQG